MNTFLSTLGAAVIVLPLFFVIIVGIIAWRSWWLYPAWAWFLVPLGVPQISFWHFAALLMLISMITNAGDYKEDKRPIDWSKVFAAFIAPIITWVILWWIHR